MKHNFHKTVIYLALMSIFSATSYASVVRGDVDYEEFRNFAENRGRFEAGKLDIPVYDKRGNFLGNVFPKGVPMPSFDSVEKGWHIATLVHPQYFTSVRHNSDRRFFLNEPERGLTFGTPRYEQNGVKPFLYKVVDRNDHTGGGHDFNAPRLHKMVTEVEPAELPYKITFDDFRNGRFAAFARVGTGTQYVVEEDKNTLTKVGEHSRYAIGGTPVGGLGRSGDHEKDNGSRGYYAVATDLDIVAAHVYNDRDNSSPMPNYTRPGDSGSPLFGFDKKLNRWILVGHLARGNPLTSGNSLAANYYSLMEPDFVKRMQNDDLAATVALLGGNEVRTVDWRRVSDGQSEMSVEGKWRKVRVGLARGSDLNNGKDVVFDLFSSFDKNKLDLVLHDDINQGAGGLYFKLPGVVRGKNDATTWVGSGVYISDGKQVEWQVKNPSGDRMSKLGKGTLLVNGKGVNEGDISVGDGKVVLAQKADAEGRKQAFGEVQLASGRGVVVLEDADQLKDTKISFGYRGGLLDMNGNNLKLGRISHMDDGATISNLKHKYVTLTMDNNNVHVFKGNIGHAGGKAKLSLSYLPARQSGALAVTGNVDVDGYVHVERKGRLVFTGEPVKFASAYNDYDKYTDNLNWKNRSVRAGSSFYVRGNGVMDFGRNIARVQGAFKGSGNGIFRVGFVNDASLDCWEGETACSEKMLSDQVIRQLPTTQAHGDVNLAHKSQLVLGKAHLYGGANAGDASRIHLTEDARWTLTKDSKVNELVLNSGSKIYLNPDKQFDHFNTLEVNGKLSGNGHFRFSTNLAGMAHNKLLLNGEVEGRHTLSLLDSGIEPKLADLDNGLSGIRLVDMKQANPNAKFVFENGYVDAGAYRYVLNRDFGFKRTDKPAGARPKTQESSTVEKPAEVAVVRKPVSDGKADIYDPRLSSAGRLELMSVANPDDNGAQSLNAVRSAGSQADVMSAYSNEAVKGFADAQRNASQAFEAFAEHAIHSDGQTAVWMNVRRSSAETRSDDYRGGKDHATLVQVGADFKHRNIAAGAAYTENRLSKERNAKTAGVYLKHQWDNGVFALADVQAGRVENGYGRQGLVRLGATAGAELKAGNTTVTPYAGAAAAHIAGTDYVSDGAKVRVPSQNLLTYHAGVKAAHKFDLGEAELKPFAAVHYVGSNQKQDVHVNDAVFAQKFDNRISAEGGAELKVKQFKLTVSAGVGKGKELKRDKHFNIKAAYTW